MSRTAGWTEADVDRYIAKHTKSKLDEIDKAEKYPAKECEFQKRCDEYLERLGFARRTPKKLQQHHNGLWFVHLAQAKRNPILLDYLILDSNAGRYVEAGDV